jgi:putative peptidoglycan lipid II flippase
VALGLAASNTVALALRGWGLRKRLGGLNGRGMASTYGKALLAALGAAVVGVGIRVLAPDTYGQAGVVAIAQSLAIVAVAGGAMLGTYVGLARLLRLDELNDVVRAFTNRLRRRVT